MDYLTAGVVALCGLGLGALWRLSKSFSVLGQVQQIALRNQQTMAEVSAKLDTLDSRQDKNFHEIGSAFVEMKCKVKLLEEKVHGKSGGWNATLGSNLTA